MDLEPTVPAPNRQDRLWLEGGLVVLDDCGCIVDSNEAIASWLGSTPTQLEGTNFLDLITQKRPAWRQDLERLFARPERITRSELVHEESDAKHWIRIETACHNEVRFIRLNSILPPRAELEEGAWDEHLQTGGARREMFMRLVRAEAQLDNLLRRWPGVILSQRADHSIRFASPQIAELAGVSADEATKQPGVFWRLVHEADVDELQQRIKRLDMRESGFTCTYRIRHLRSGRVAYILEHREAVHSPTGLLLGYEAIWLDVTRQTIAENRLTSAAWKETLAVLTMGLAHDFSNIMAGIHSLSEAFQSQIEPTHPFQEGLLLIRRNSMQASQLVHRILNLHQGKVGSRSYHNLNELLSDTVELMRKVIPRRVKIHVDTTKDDVPIYADSVEFRQVLINLALNAADAMPKGGALRFTTTLHTAPPALDQFKGTQPRCPIVALQVADEGSGIAARHLPHIFDPFFTTKAVNKGSGLGLYNARLFVEKHQGSIGVQSIEGKGTKFTILLPQADFTESERVSAEISSRRHTLLLLGPGGQALETTASFLRENGFYVVIATSEDAGEELFRSTDYQFTAILLLTRGEEPKGSKLFELAHAATPPVNTVLLISGCNQDDIDTRVMNRSDLILPPDTPAYDMAARIKSLCDSKQNPTL